MTHKTPESSNAGKPRRWINGPFHGITWPQALHDYHDGLLTAKGLIYYFFAIHLHPGAEMHVDVADLCARLGIHTGTYYRAIGALKSRGRLNIRRGRMIIGVPEIQPLFEFSQSSEKNSQNCEKESQPSESQSQLSDSGSQNCESQSQSCENANRPDALQGKDSRNSANVPKQRDQIFKTYKPLIPTHRPVGYSGINREGSGISSPGVSRSGIVSKTSMLEELAALIQASGITLNTTIQTTLVELLNANDLAAARHIVENALSALQEQEQRSQVRNPGGFLKAALQRGFTANQAKRDARLQPQRRQPPNLIQVASAIDQALANGDRAFALAKLQSLWHDGWHDEIKDLVEFLHPNWPFVITDEGIHYADE